MGQGSTCAATHEVPDFSRVPESIGGVHVYDASQRATADQINEQAHDLLMPVYLPDMFRGVDDSWNRSGIPHGYLMLLNLLTTDVDRDKRADIHPREVLPIDLYNVLLKGIEAPKLEGDEDADLREVLRQRMRSAHEALFGVAFALRGGLVNQSYVLGFNLLKYGSEILFGALPQWSPGYRRRASYRDVALTPSQLKAAQAYILARAAWSKQKPASARTLNDDSLIAMAEQWELFDMMSMHHIVFQSAGNDQALFWHILPGENLVSAAWLTSSAVAVGGLTPDGSSSIHAVKLADVGAPFDARFLLIYRSDGTVEWKNAKSGLSIVTACEAVPFEATYVVSDRQEPISFLDKEGKAVSVDRVIDEHQPVSGPNKSFLPSGRLEESGDETRIVLAAQHGPVRTIRVVAADQRVVMREKDESSPEMRGAVYYKDEDRDGVADRPKEIVFRGTSPSNQYAVALARLVLRGFEKRIGPQEGQITPSEFNRRFVKALHRQTGGRIIPSRITPRLLASLQRSIFSRP